MDVGRGFGGGSDFMSLLDNSNRSLWVPSSSRSFHHEAMMKFDQEGQFVRRSPTVERLRGSDEEEEFEAGNLFSQPEKKRRLTAEQVQFLERNFEKENKLEPDRKVELAKQLGLQPRQVAIWFQNRRARYKSKQLEKEYDSLKASYDQLMLDFDSLLTERDDLQNQVKSLTKELKQRETGQSEMDPDSPVNNAHNSDTQQHKRKPEWRPVKVPKMGAASNGKQTEDAISPNSDVLDSESTEDGNQLEDPVDSTHILDPDLQSDFSQDEEDPQLMSLLPPTPVYHDLLKMDQDQDQNQDQDQDLDEECYELDGNTCNFSLVDDPPIWPWRY